MHICFLCHEYPPGRHGGVGTFVQTIGRALVARGHQVSVVGVYPAKRKGIEDDRGVRVIRLPHAFVRGTGFLIHSARLRQTLMRLHRETPIDVVEGPELSLALIPKDFPAAKLIRMHGGHHFFAVTLGRQPRPWRSWLETRSFARADHLCAVSRFVADTTRHLLNLENRSVEVIYNSVNPSLFPPQSPAAESEGLILFVGSVCEKKGVRQLIQAMPAIVQAVPHARLWIVGRDSGGSNGGSFTERLRRLIAPELIERVIFKGPVENSRIPEILAQAQVCVYPSHMEAMPLTWLEGMAMGKAVVASMTGPGPEAIEDGISGLLCNPHEPASIANRVITLLKDADLRNNLGRQARLSIINRFSMEVMIERNEAFYDRCARASVESRKLRDAGRMKTEQRAPAA